MITMRNFAASAVATLGLFVFGAVNSANAGHPSSGREMGHGPVVNSSGKFGKESGKFDKNKFDKERKEWEHKYWNRYTYRHDYCFPACSYPVETCAPVCEVPVVPQSVCEVPGCPEPTFVPTTCCEYPCSYDFCKPCEFHKPCYDDCHPWHRERPLEGSKPTTASSHRNTENLGSMGSKPTTASSHRNSENLGSMASHTSGGRGRK